MEEIIIGRQGNQKTPISDVTVSRKHCRLTSNGNGTYLLENLSSLGTKVDGLDVIQTTVTPDSLIQLGPNYKAKLKDLIGINSTSRTNDNKASTQQEKKETKTFKTSHLKKIYEEYEEYNLHLANAQHKINITRAGFGIFTMCAMPTIFFLGPLGLGALGYVLTGIGIAGNVYSYIGMKNVDTPAIRKQRQDEFEEKWVCPNPECGHSLIPKKYKTFYNDYIRPGLPCPYCKCKYTE